MNELELIVKMHQNNRRQGPGDDRLTALALDLSSIDLNRELKIADIGCGTGCQTMVLAQKTQGKIVAVDLFQQFLDKLNERAAKEKLTERITTLQCHMDALPFENEEFDIIWSEGAVYNMGFRNGIRYWKQFLKKNGIIAVSEISWTTAKRPQEIENYWKGNYPEIGTVSEKIKVMEDEGYAVVGYFLLPEYCWTENYYAILEQSYDSFLEEMGNSTEAQAIVNADKEEIDKYKRFKDYYSYGFYIAKKV